VEVETVLEEGEESSNEYGLGGSKTAGRPTIGGSKTAGRPTIGIPEATSKPLNSDQDSSGDKERTAKDDLLKDVSRQQQERKAVKADDAAVPEYLWEEHLMTGSEVNDWNSKSIDNLRRVSSWLREHMLRWWKRRVVSSYVSWMKSKYEIEDGTADPPIVSYQSGNISYKHGLYSWTKDGRAQYKTWWTDRLVKTYVDVVPPASDAIARAANTSWWNWDNGSTPFHWIWPSHYQHII
jgi:hypothetical protein